MIKNSTSVHPHTKDYFKIRTSDDFDEPMDDNFWLGNG